MARSSGILFRQNARATALSARAKALLLSALLCFPCSWLTISISDNAGVPDLIRYAFSPGTMLANRIIRGQTHSLYEMLHQIDHWVLTALVTNMVFYGMLIFGLTTLVSALRRSQ